MCELNLIPSERTTTTRRKKIRNGKYSIKQSQKIGSQTGKVFIDFVAVAAAAFFVSTLVRLYSSHGCRSFMYKRTRRLDSLSTSPSDCSFVYSALRRFNIMIHEQFANRFFPHLTKSGYVCTTVFSSLFHCFFPSLVPILLQHPLN